MLEVYLLLQANNSTNSRVHKTKYKVHTMALRSPYSKVNLNTHHKQR